MSQQRLVFLLYALIFAWLRSTAGSMRINNSDLAVQVFSSLQTSSNGNSLPPYPEGIELELACQATAHTTFWFERRPPNAYPDASKDKLPSRSANPVPSVSQSVFTIPHLEGKDDGRELWCTMDGSSIKKVVKLTVVGLSNVFVTTRLNAASDGWELLCSLDSLHPELELCWYRGENILRCLEGHAGQASTTVRTHCTDVGKQEGEAVLQCKPRLKDKNAMDTLTEKTRDQFNKMFDKAAKKHQVNLTDTNCKEILQHTHSSTHARTPTSVLKPINETHRTKNNTPSNETTTTSTTLSLATIFTTTQSTTSALPTTLKSSTTGTTSTVTQPSATSRPTTEWVPWTPTTTQTLLMITAALLFGLFFTSITSVIMIVKLRQTRTSVQNVYIDSQGAPNGNQPFGDGRGQVGNIPRRLDGIPDGISHCRVRVDDLESGQSVPGGVGYPGAVDMSEHRWPGEGVPLSHAYYYPEITEQDKEEILNGNRPLACGISRGRADRTVDSTRNSNIINHSYHYPVLTEEMKRLLSTNSEQGCRPTIEGGGAPQ